MTDDRHEVERPGETPGATTRKGFLDRILGATAAGFLAAVFYPVGRYLLPPEAAEATANSVAVPFSVDEIPRNSGRIFRFGTRPGLLIRTPGGELRAFSARCTHLDCTVQYRDDLEHIWCACHNGHFDLNGRNIAGPPPEPLEEYTVHERGSEIIVSKNA